MTFLESNSFLPSEMMLTVKMTVAEEVVLIVVMVFVEADILPKKCINLFVSCIR